MNIKMVKKIAKPIFKSRGVKRAAVFGSYARNTQARGSDIDILIEMKNGSSLLDLISIESELQRKLKKKVDVLTFNSLHPKMKRSVLKDSRMIYEK